VPVEGTGTLAAGMALLYPLLIAVAIALAWRSRAKQSGRGLAWFGWWAVAGFLMAFTFVTGLSIGLFILPVAAAALLWVARRSPHLRESAGFLTGIGGTVLLIAILNYV
jgi:hypothetical protein